MNTIKIYLAESGRIADLHKDFPLYQYQYQNKLLNVFVPTSILAPQFTTLSDEGQTLSEYVAGTAVKIGMRYLTRSGEIKISQSSYLRYLKTLTYQNVEYALFERKLPKEFTLYAGQGQNAPTLIINVVNIETDVEPAETLSIIPSQTCSLDVMPSSNLDNDEAIEPSELETINGRLNAIDETLAEKQDKVDESIQLTTDSDDNPTWQDSQSVVGAINNNTAQNELNKTNIQTNTEDIAQNKSDIEYLYEHSAQPEEYIGQMTGSSLPTEAQLTQFVEDTAGREPKNADVIIFVLQVAGGTDKNYKYTYSVDGWNGYEIPLLEEADNGSLGLIKGTYGVGSSNNTLVDISGGAILNIYVKDSTNTFRNIREYLNTNASNIANIINGTTSVGMALRAVADKLGHDITDTYLTINAGVTKQQLKDYALPREFNDVNFFTADGYSGQLPTGSSPIHTLTTSAVGDFEFFTAIKTLSNTTFQLSNKNSYTDTLFISASLNCVVQFRLTTEIYVNNSWEIANVELTDEIEMINGQIKKISLASSFNYLQSVYTLTDGDKIRQTLEIVTQTSNSISFNVYSNSVYPSTFYLNTQSTIIEVLSGNIGQEQSLTALGSAVTGGIDFELPTNTILYNDTSAEFTLIYAGVIADEDIITLSLFGQTIILKTPYNISGGNVLGKYLKQCYFETDSSRTEIRFKGFVNIDSGDNIIIKIEEDNFNVLKRVESISAGGTPLTPDANKNVNIPYANATDGGVIKVKPYATSGLLMEGGFLYTYPASEYQINNKTNTKCQLTPNNIDLIAKVGVTTNTISLTDQEKQTAQTWLGVSCSNPNLLINGDFRVNQRGQTSYTGNYKYTADRWQQGSGSFDYSTKTWTPTIQYSGFVQKMEDFEKFKGQTVTLSVKITGCSTSGVFDLLINDGSNHRTASPVTSGFSGIRTFTYTVSSTATQLRFGLIYLGTASTDTISFEWIKAEVGEVATPFSPRPYAEELAMCKRYYQKIRIQGGAASSSNTTDVYAIFPLDTQLRYPITITTINLPLLQGNGTTQTATSITYNSNWGNGLQLLIKGVGLVQYYVYSLANGDIEADAEIY